MEKVLVVGYPDRLEEFRRLDIKGVSIDYLNQASLDFQELSENLREELLSGDEWDDIMEEEALDPEGGGEGVISPENVNYEDYTVIFDLNLDEIPENILNYCDLDGVCVIGCAVLKSLREIVGSQLVDLECNLFGMNALPTFIHRPRLEMSAFDRSQKPALDKVMYELGLPFDLVDDRVGMVSARIICMIINEAFFMMGEGTAGEEEIDTAMKLGTNYPEGPLAWGRKIGYHHVEELLRVLREETGDPRYKISPALAKYKMHPAGQS